MRAHIDDPAPPSPVDPLCFAIRGWLWLDRPAADVSAVETSVEGTPLHHNLLAIATNPA